MQRSSTPSRTAQGQTVTERRPNELHGGVTDDRSGETLPGPGRGDAGQAVPFGDRQSAEGVDGGPQLCAAHDPFDERALTARRRAAQPCQLLERAGGDGDRGRVLPPDAGRDVPQFVPDAAPQRPHLKGRRRVLGEEELVGQVAGAERQRHREVRHPAPSEGHFERAAPDVEHGHRSRPPAHPAPRGEERQLGLQLARQRAQGHAGPLPHGPQHVGAVGRVAHDGGGEGARGARVPPACGVPRRRDRLRQLLHRVVVDRAVRPQVLRQPQLPLHGVDREGNSALGVRHHQSHRVRPGVHDTDPHDARSTPEGPSQTAVLSGSRPRRRPVRSSASGRPRPAGTFPPPHPRSGTAAPVSSAVRPAGRRGCPAGRA